MNKRQMKKKKQNKIVLLTKRDYIAARIDNVERLEDMVRKIIRKAKMELNDDGAFHGAKRGGKGKVIFIADYRR